MTYPLPITACLSQAGPFRTSARLEIRTDRYFMEDIRMLARSARCTAAQFTHPRLVSLAEFTTTRAVRNQPICLSINQCMVQPISRPSLWSPSFATMVSQSSTRTEHRPSPLSTSSTTFEEHLRPLSSQGGTPLTGHTGQPSHTVYSDTNRPHPGAPQSRSRQTTTTQNLYVPPPAPSESHHDGSSTNHRKPIPSRLFPHLR